MADANVTPPKDVKPPEPDAEARVVWEGKSGIRNLSVADFKKLGIKAEGNYSFYRNQPQLVPAKMAEGLASSTLVPGFRVLD